MFEQNRTFFPDAKGLSVSGRPADCGRDRTFRCATKASGGRGTPAPHKHLQKADKSGHFFVVFSKETESQHALTVFDLMSAPDTVPPPKTSHYVPFCPISNPLIVAKNRKKPETAWSAGGSSASDGSDSFCSDGFNVRAMAAQGQDHDEAENWDGGPRPSLRASRPRSMRPDKSGHVSLDFKGLTVSAHAARIDCDTPQKPLIFDQSTKE